jgi:hypothetical protein
MTDHSLYELHEESGSGPRSQTAQAAGLNGTRIVPMPSERDVLVKTTPLRSVRAFLDEHLKPEAKERVIAKAAGEFPDHAQRLRERTLIATERVPVAMVNRLIELAAEELGEPPTQVAHRIGRRAADEAAKGILRLAMVMISIPSLLRKLAPVWTQLYSHGTMSSRADGKSAVVELADFPVVSATGCARITGWLEWFAEKAESGATIRHSSCTAKGDRICRWDLQW